MPTAPHIIREFLWGYYGSEGAVLTTLPPCPSQFQHRVAVNSGHSDPMAIGDAYVFCQGPTGQCCLPARLPPSMCLSTITRILLVLMFYGDTLHETQPDDHTPIRANNEDQRDAQEGSQGASNGAGALRDITNLPN